MGLYGGREYGIVRRLRYHCLGDEWSGQQQDGWIFDRIHYRLSLHNEAIAEALVTIEAFDLLHGKYCELRLQPPSEGLAALHAFDQLTANAETFDG